MSDNQGHETADNRVRWCDSNTDVESRLRRHSQMLEAFFQHTITPLAFMDRDFNFIRVNEAYAAAGGKPPEYFVGRNHFSLYPHDENRAIFEQVVQTREPYHAYAKPFDYLDSPPSAAGRRSQSDAGRLGGFVGRAGRYERRGAGRQRP